MSDKDHNLPVMRLQWKDLGPAFNLDKIGGARATLVGNRLYFFGGDNTKYFGGELCMQPWGWKDIICGMKERRAHFPALVDDKIYLYGGESLRGVEKYLGEILEYDVVTGEFTVLETYKSTVAGKRSGAVGVYAPWRREIIMFGGISYLQQGSNIARLNDTVAFHVDRRAWTKLKMKGQLPPHRTGHETALMGTRMYLYGGYVGNTNYLGDLWVADLSVRNAATWSKVQPIGEVPRARAIPFLQRMHNRLLLYGGYTNRRNVTLDSWFFYPNEKKWKRVSEDADARVIGTPPIQAGRYVRIKAADGLMITSHSRVLKLQVV